MTAQVAFSLYTNIFVSQDRSKGKQLSLLQA